MAEERKNYTFQSSEELISCLIDFSGLIKFSLSSKRASVYSNHSLDWAHLFYASFIDIDDKALKLWKDEDDTVYFVLLDKSEDVKKKLKEEDRFFVRRRNARVRNVMKFEFWIETLSL